MITAMQPIFDIPIVYLIFDINAKDEWIREAQRGFNPRLKANGRGAILLKSRSSA
jgi:hypothetical protein